MESWKAAGSFSWGVERQEKVGERIAAGVGIKPGDARDARDAALEAASGDEDDDVDRLGDQPARDGDDRLLPEALEAVEGRHGTVDRKSVVEGKSVSVRVDLGGRRTLKKKK